MPPTATDTAEHVDTIFRALASRPRREILRILASGEGADDERCCGVGAVCACVFSERLGIGAPTVSHHMKALLEAGLITAEKRGLWVYYRLHPEGFEAIAAELASLTPPPDCSTEAAPGIRTKKRAAR
jgi:ArsR family transcriptional regulator